MSAIRSLASQRRREKKEKASCNGMYPASLATVQVNRAMLPAEFRPEGKKLEGET